MFSSALAAKPPGGQVSLDSLPPEVQFMLKKLANPDLRSGYLLADTLKRVERLLSPIPELLAFTYDLSPDPQTAAQKTDQLEQQISAKGVDFVQRFNQAKRANPNPSKYHLAPIYGFTELLARGELQRKQFERMWELLQDLHSRQQVLKDRMQRKTAVALEAVRRRDAKLQHRLVRISGLLEEYAMETNIAQVDAQFLHHLQGELSNIQQEINRDAGVARIAELRHSLQAALDQASSDWTLDAGEERDAGSGATTGVSLCDKDAQRVFEVIDKTQELMASLHAHIKSFDNAVECLKNGLERSAIGMHSPPRRKRIE